MFGRVLAWPSLQILSGEKKGYFRVFDTVGEELSFEKVPVNYFKWLNRTSFMFPGCFGSFLKFLCHFSFVWESKTRALGGNFVLQRCHLQSWMRLFANSWKLASYNWALLLAILFGSFLHTIGAFLLTIELLCLQWELRLINTSMDCKQRSSTVSKKAPTVSRKAYPLKFDASLSPSCSCNQRVCRRKCCDSGESIRLGITIGNEIVAKLIQEGPHSVL